MEIKKIKIKIFSQFGNLIRFNEINEKIAISIKLNDKSNYN